MRDVAELVLERSALLHPAARLFTVSNDSRSDQIAVVRRRKETLLDKHFDPAGCSTLSHVSHGHIWSSGCRVRQPHKFLYFYYRKGFFNGSRVLHNDPEHFSGGLLELLGRQQ